MTNLKFIRYILSEDYIVARMETTGEEEGVPVNILAVDGSDPDIPEGVICELEVCGIVDDIKVFEDEAAWSAHDKDFAAIHMIPTGTFPLKGSASDPREDAPTEPGENAGHPEAPADAPEDDGETKYLKDALREAREAEEEAEAAEGFEELYEDPDQMPTIRFAGRVTDLQFDPEAPGDEPNYSLTVTTYGLELTVLTHYDDEIRVGNIVSGDAWLYAEL